MIVVVWETVNYLRTNKIKGYQEGMAQRGTDTKKPPSGGHDITAYCFVILEFIFLVPGAGLEPAQP